MLEGSLENTNISLYPINEKVILGSRTTIMETGCHSGDAIHLYTCDEAYCDYFITADKELTTLIRNSKLTYRLKVVDTGEDKDVENFLSNF
jgi:predicted nucleic acid-binding protein